MTSLSQPSLLAVEMDCGILSVCRLLYASRVSEHNCIAFQPNRVPDPYILLWQKLLIAKARGNLIPQMFYTLRPTA